MNRRGFIGMLGALGIVPLAKIAEPAKVETGGFLVPGSLTQDYEIKTLADPEPDTFIWKRQPACVLYARRTYFNPGETWKEIGIIEEMTMPREEDDRKFPFGPILTDIHITLQACDPSLLFGNVESTIDHVEFLTSMLDFEIIKFNTWEWQYRQRWKFQGNVTEFNTYYAETDGGGVDLVIKPDGPVEWSFEPKEGK